MPTVGAMDRSDVDMLDAVVEELTRRRGELADIASDAGLSYDTVLRIKNRENDPGYSRVKKLREVLNRRQPLHAAPASEQPAEARHAA